MKQFFTLCLLLLSLLARGQSQGSSTLSYETPASRNGLRYADLNFKWKVERASFFADMTVIFEATASPTYTEYVYRGQYYRSHGEGDSNFRKVKASSYRVQARVEGPGFSKIVVLGGEIGMSGGSFWGNSLYLMEAKSKEQADPANWTVTPLAVIEIGWDGGWDLQNQLDAEAAARKKREAATKAQEAGDEAGRRGDWAGAIQEYRRARGLDASNEAIGQRLARAEEELRKKGVKERYDDLLKTAREAESRGDKKAAQRLYDQAVETGHDDVAARQASSRVAREVEQEEKRRAEEQAAKEAAETAKAEAAQKARQEEAQQVKEKMEALQRAQAQAQAARHDSLRSAVAAAERIKLDEAREKQQREQREQEEAEEKRQEDELKEAAAKRRAGDQDELAAAEAHMADNPELYQEALRDAETARDEAMAIRSFEALELKKEWWDNNEYIQVIADELYEDQRQTNLQEYMRRLYAEHGAWYSTKYKYIAAIEYVDRDSPRHKFLLRQIEFCNDELDSNELMRKGSFRMETNRRKIRDWNKMMVEGQRRAANHQKAAAAFLVYEMNVSPENPGKYVMDKYEFEQRLNQADEQYKRDAVVTGVSQSVALNVLADDSKTAQAAKNGSAMINAYVGGLGLEATPMLMNHTSDLMGGQTKTDDILIMPFTAGLDMWFVRSHHIDLGLGAYGSFGVFPSEGTKAAALGWGGKARLDLGLKHFKLANTVEYLGRTGSQEVDYDVAQANNANYQFQNHIAKGEYSYEVLRVGTGFKVDFSDEYDDMFALVQVFGEKPSFYPGDLLKKPVFSYRAEAQLGSGWNMRLAYAQNYVVAGEKLYALADVSNKSYWCFMIGKTWTLLNTH